MLVIAKGLNRDRRIMEKVTENIGKIKTRINDKL